MSEPLAGIRRMVSRITCWLRQSQTETRSSFVAEAIHG